MAVTQTHVVPIGPCRLYFGGVDLGYTIEGVVISYVRTVEEKYVDTSDAPVDVITTKRSFTVSAQLGEYSLEKLSEFMGQTQFAKITNDDGDTIFSHLAVGGGLEGSLAETAKELHIVPLQQDENHLITVRHAVPLCNQEWTYSKDSVRSCAVEFRAMNGENGFVSFGSDSIPFA